MSNFILTLKKSVIAKDNINFVGLLEYCSKEDVHYFEISLKQSIAGKSVLKIMCFEDEEKSYSFRDEFVTELFNQ